MKVKIDKQEIGNLIIWIKTELVLEIAQYWAVKAKQVEEDALAIQNNLKAFKAIYDSFRAYNKYNKIDTKVRVHFKAYLNKVYANQSSIVDDLPELYLTSIKPFKQLEE